MNQTLQAKLTELSQKDQERLDDIRNKLINKKITPDRYHHLILENTRKFKKELFDIMNEKI